ncbi:MAG: hypothetical protein Q9168_004409 [Polycauliona sp. 1 TL-2023]
MGNRLSSTIQSPSGDDMQTAKTQSPPSTNTFPFEKLPTELQLMVVRFAMPQNGLRFRRQINITSNDAIPTGEVPPKDLKDQMLAYGGYGFLYTELKEKLRLICDMLVENPNIQRLTVIIPCRCTLPRANGSSPIDDLLHDYLTTLQRIKVAKPVIFIPGRGLHVQTEADICRKRRCSRLAKSMTSKFRNLNGEPLSHREETWTVVKALQRPTGRWTRMDHRWYMQLSEYFLDYLSNEDVDDQVFRAQTELVISQWNTWYHNWELRQPTGKPKQSQTQIIAKV